MFRTRPVLSSGQRVASSDFNNYRTAREFAFPYCHCTQNGVAIESAIYVTVEGEFWGEYVATCAADRCGYLGEQE
jgi:hypothetical protein